MNKKDLDEVKASSKRRMSEIGKGEDREKNRKSEMLKESKKKALKKMKKDC